MKRAQRGRRRTGVIGVMLGCMEDLDRAGKVHQVELLMEGDEDLNRIVRRSGRLSSHLDLMLIGMNDVGRCRMYC